MLHRLLHRMQYPVRNWIMFFSPFCSFCNARMVIATPTRRSDITAIILRSKKKLSLYNTVWNYANFVALNMMVSFGNFEIDRKKTPLWSENWNVIWVRVQLYRIKTQESIAAVHLNALLMVTRVTYMNDFQVNLYIKKCSEPWPWSECEGSYRIIELHDLWAVQLFTMGLMRSMLTP